MPNATGARSSSSWNPPSIPEILTVMTGSQDLIELTRDGSAAHRLARRGNALLLLDDGMSCQAVGKTSTWTTTRSGPGIGCIKRMGSRASLASADRGRQSGPTARPVRQADATERLALPKPAKGREALGSATTVSTVAAVSRGEDGMQRWGRPRRSLTT